MQYQIDYGIDVCCGAVADQRLFFITFIMFWASRV
jgi:hypothetical protein